MQLKVTLFFVAFLPFALLAQTSAGPMSPGAAANTSCPFSYSSNVDYLPAANISASDDVYASASHCDCCDANTRCLEATDFGFSIPITAIIDGIEVRVEKKASTNSTVQDNGVRIIKNGSTTGNDHLTSASWGYADAVSTYGSPIDLWGTTWTVADVNATNFGIAFASISYTCFGNGNPVISYIDHITITVYYTDITGVGAVSSDGTHTMKIFPNPSNGIATITVPSGETKAVVKCVNVTGQTVLSLNKELVNGAIRLEETATLSEGIYFIEISAGENRWVEKMIVE